MPVVYLIDERVNHAQGLLRHVPQGDLGFLVGPYLSVREVVSKLMEGMKALEVKAARERSEPPLINELRILASGHAEELRLGWGINARNAVQLSPISLYMSTGASGKCLLLGYNAAVATPQRESFLGGSATGQRFGSPGHGWGPEDLAIPERPRFELLRAIARALGVPVLAGLQTQTMLFDWRLPEATVKVDPFGNTTYTGMDTPPSFLY